MPKLNESEIRELETRFDLTLPEFYRRFLSDHDESLESLDVGSGPLGEQELMAQPSKLISVNERVRSPDMCFFGEHPWPSAYFVIGEDVYNCHYFIDTTGQHKGVLFQDVYSWDIEHVAEDCGGLVQYLKDKAAG